MKSDTSRIDFMASCGFFVLVEHHETIQRYINIFRTETLANSVLAKLKMENPEAEYAIVNQCATDTRWMTQVRDWTAEALEEDEKITNRTIRRLLHDLIIMRDLGTSPGEASLWLIAQRTKN